ncbi:MAG: 3-deoxy-manno-octulosonate cytidylyltransferase [Gammaproteobacteria bacterium]
MSFKVFVPARFASTRLPGKPLAELDGRPMIAHVCERASESGAAAVVVATDDERIAAAAERAGADVCMTSAACASGTDRVAEAAARREEADECVIVNLQGDEPEMPASVIRQVAALAAEPGCDMATVCEPLSAAQVFDPNVVKVVRDRTGRALYFSRAPIPYDREAFAAGLDVPALAAYRRHVGIYGYRVGFLRRFVAMPQALLERLEALEQLRALDAGAVIRVADAVAACGRGVDTPADLAALRGEQ